MKTPQYPAGPAFEKAAEAMEAWRRQQIAALTDAQRHLYEQACRKAKEHEEDKARELEKSKLAEIQERMRRKLLEAQHLEFNFQGNRTKITDEIARRLIAEHFQPGMSQDTMLFTSSLKRIEQFVTAEVEREHALELKAVQDHERENTDELLRSCERAREAQPENRAEFARAGVRDKARTDFGKAGEGDGVIPGITKSEAIARAIARVKEKEEEERTRGDRDQGRGRSVTDSFNKAR